MLVADDSGRLFVGEKCFAQWLPARSSARFGERSDQLCRPLWAGTVPSFPDYFSMPFFIPLRGWGARRPIISRAPFAGSRFDSTPANFDANLMERLIQTWSRDLTTKVASLSPRSYLAVLRQNPGVETGVGVTTEQAGYHLLLGYY